jgi:hypothetical protein
MRVVAMGRIGLVVIVIVAVAGAFLAGRASRQTHVERVPIARASFDAGYLAGREAAFGGYDGGWAYGTPYLVTLERGGRGITYRFASRAPLSPGIEYRACGHGVCTRRAG